jgi:alpha-mannosidase
VSTKYKDGGPFSVSVLIKSDAPGCRHLSREIRVVEGLNRIDITNRLDKLPVREKEGVHFGFGFNVPDGKVRMDVGWAVPRVNDQQMPGSCCNWFTVQRFVDISNDKYGVTWATPDAPLVELGSITGTLLGSQRDPNAWIERAPDTQTLYSWVMNNHWHTNYRAEQEGPTEFRYSICPHGPYNAAEAVRFGIERSQPLLVVSGKVQKEPALKLSVEPSDVLLVSMKPSQDGKAVLFRLFGAGDKPAKAKLHWGQPAPKQVWLSDLMERPLTAVTETIDVPAWGIVTLRAELP